MTNVCLLLAQLVKAAVHHLQHRASSKLLLELLLLPLRRMNSSHSSHDECVLTAAIYIGGIATADIELYGTHSSHVSVADIELYSSDVSAAGCYLLYNSYCCLS